MSVRSILFLFVFVSIYIATAQKHGYDELVDSRDGKKYKILTVKHELVGEVFVERTWMAENLNYKVEESSCYKNEKAYCKSYGRLYTFKAAKEACPEGWHVPTIDEWTLLFETFDGDQKAGFALQKGGRSGLNLLFGGFGDPGNVFKNMGISGNYWDSEKRSSNTSGLVSLQRNSPEIYHSVIGNWHRNSCRCIKDYE